MIIHDGLTKARLEGKHDPNSALFYTFALRPDVWQANKVYYTGKSLVVPPVWNGFYYEAKSGGMSGSSAPTFPCKKGETVEDSCVLWKAVPYDLYLPDDVDIATDGATWSADDTNVTISDVTTVTNKTKAKISTVPATLKEVEITIHFTFSNDEEDDRSFIISVAEL